jgi:hypothetical protein
VKTSPNVVTLGAVAGAAILMLSGCSLFQRPSTTSSQVVPTSVSSPGVMTTEETVTPTTATTAASSTPVRQDPVPPTVRGYTLATSSSTVPIQRRFEAVAGQFRGVFSGLTARNVLKGKQTVGSVVLLALSPELVGNTQVEQRLVPGMVKGMSGQGAKVTTQKVNGQSVAVATTKSTNIVAWYRSGVVVLVLSNGTDSTESLAFAKAYLAAQ